MSIRERIAGARDEGYSAAKTDDVENLYVDTHFSSHYSHTKKNNNTITFYTAQGI